MYSDRRSATGSVALLTLVFALFAVVTTKSYGQAFFGFEEPTIVPGTVFGAGADPPQMPGDFALMDNGIIMTVEPFFPISGVDIFGEAIVGGEHTVFFESTPLQLNNINVLFDATHAGFDVDMLRLQYAEFSGVANLMVNGETLYIVDLLTQVPESVAGGVMLSIETEPSTLLSVLTLTGPINTFEIGGQEVSIDNVSFVPEPTSLLLLLAGVAMIRRPRQ